MNFGFVLSSNYSTSKKIFEDSYPLAERANLALHFGVFKVRVSQYLRATLPIDLRLTDIS
jgi:hypothetical protein